MSEDTFLSGAELANEERVPLPIMDGSQALAHDGYDVQLFREAVVAFAKLGEATEQGRRHLVTAPALIRDLFWSFHKHVPRVDPIVEMTQAYAVNRQIVEQVLATIEWEQARGAGTMGDLLNTALATVGTAAKALAALDNATISRVNYLHELESGAVDLFNSAEALEDLAAQAEGDRAQQLYDQAREARRQAEEERAEAERLAAELEASAEDREDAVRRAARRGMQEVEAEIAAMNTAIGAYSGAYGPGEAQRLTPQEKIALARKVQSSRRLKEIAAMCGRFTRIALRVQHSKVKHPPDEVTSITIGRDLAHLLPAELALLSDPQLEDLFFLKFAEGRLMQYALVGNERQGQGPIIVALDSSGSMAESMGGMTKEAWSKAVTLALLAIARKQRRDMAVMHFSSDGQLKTWTFERGEAPYSEVVACIDHFYAGGTVFEPWMHATLKQVDEARFDKADVICISDGLTTIDEPSRAEWQQRRQQRGMRAYAVLIGSREGAGVLASITDALLTLDNLTEDTPILETIFNV